MVKKAKKKGGRGKRKGSGFERTVCKTLSRFIDPKGEDTLFWRSAMSGGRATVQGRKGIKNKTQLGDITCVHESGQWLTDLFVLECKFYRSLDIESGLLSGKGKMVKFWKDVCKVAKENDRAPLLIAKQNNTSILAIFNKEGLAKFRTFGHEAHPIVISKLWPETAYVCLFEEVFK